MAHILRLADMLFNQPLLATENLATSVAAYLKARMFGDLTDPSLAVNFNKPQGDVSRYLRVSEGTAILPVMGGLTHRPMLMDALCTGGLSSYSGIMKAFDEAMADDSVERIVMHVDSGGGQATGCFDLAYHIMANRGKKPITAYVDGMACSAAYALACSADEIIASPYADVGSIGVLMIHEDYSKMLAKDGIAITTFKAGANKAMGSPYAPLSKEAKETIQARIDDLYDNFTNLVADARGANMSQSDAKETEASVYNAQDALQIGLIDQIMTPDEFVAYITPSTTSASVAQTNVAAANAEAPSSQETEMNEQELKELNELRAFKAAAEAQAAQAALNDAIGAIQPQATALGFDATTAVSVMSNLSAEHKTFFMSVVDGAFAKLSEVNAQMAALQETHEKELSNTKQAAQTAVEQSTAMEELGGSGEAAADENAEKNTTIDPRAAALTVAMQEMIASGKFA